MANKVLSEMGLPKSIANIFADRNLIAKDVFSLIEFELMELLDVDLAVVTAAVAHISEITCPPYQTALSLLEQRGQNENMAGNLPTSLKGLDNALCCGIPFGVVTELVGPAGIGKTQFCLKLSLLASLTSSYGDLDGSVIYIDTESTFSSRRMIEIGYNSFPEVFHTEGLAQEIAGRILVLRPTSLSEFTERFKIKVSLFQHGVKLLIIDSMAALLSGEGVQGPQRQHTLGWHISFINRVDSPEAATKLDSHLVAALGIHWAHAVSIRLVFESSSGQRFIKLAKSPLSPPLVFPFNITSAGISLLNDDGVEMQGPEIHAISCQGHNNVINFGSEMMH
ncbi:hypothetical protein K7X08_028264 [Anisodus acutangulus]|uniref:RecA family profile 1 domain-containing protein n=1 Tax=Anisodus acutangulus TaxID=402998 RepID=A0A9Q1M831_9SOLA|nr:hypothetical protein K7X08_028264 [Anisodus acutangulus]